jgi:CheY-like chemotaxis protein
MADLAKIKPIEILLADDSPGDVRLTREAGKFAGMPRPDLLLLDLNMPKKDGREVLKEIKSDHDLRLIPVVVLTTSAAEEDILRSYDLHANCFITKPVDLDQFLRVVKSIEDFWLTIVRLPHR